jgi:hypothetical protein
MSDRIIRCSLRDDQCKSRPTLIPGANAPSEIVPGTFSVELNPVRAAMVERPEHHHWSSVHANLALCEDAWVTPHAASLKWARRL